MRTALFAATVLGSLLVVGAAQAAVVLEVSGRIALGDGAPPEGTTVRLKVDLDRDGDFASYETLSARAGADGSYVSSYDLDPTDVDLEFVAFVAELLAEYESRGFEALLDAGPLPAVISFEREGYSTVTRKIATLIENPSFDALLAPLQDIHCTEDGCQSVSGAVSITNIPGGSGIARGYAEAYGPDRDMPRFPGSFSDSGGNLLISSGFMEIDFRNESGQRVTSLPSPVKVRYEVKPGSAPTLRDLVPDSGVVELPMYSFDESIGEWVREADGSLEDADGQAVAESDFPAILETAQPLFIAFSTSHFSSWNCDRPISTRTCVKGRFVDAMGNPLPGVSASVQGVSYLGFALEMMTGADGWFASDLMKSEEAGEDIDDNGVEGETFSARVRGSFVTGVYEGPAFDSPAVLATIGLGPTLTPSCRPADCECLDLGDIVAEFEAPRACTIRVSTVYSGVSLTGGAELAAGDAVAGAAVRGQFAGQAPIPVIATANLCEGSTCHAADADAEGNATFVVPVMGEAPEIRLDLEYSADVDGDLHYYTGSLIVPGCTPDETEASESFELEAVHARYEALGVFASGIPLPEAPAGPVNGSGDGEDPLGAGKGCGCTVAGGSGPKSTLWFALAVVLGLLQRRRRPAP